MKIILTRDVSPRYEEIPSPDASFGAPGTQMQTYSHAKHLTELGQEVYVIGETKKAIEKNGIKYIGTQNVDESKDFILGVVPDLIIEEGGKLIRQILEKYKEKINEKLKFTIFLKVMHNAPGWDVHVKPNYIDYWCYVSESQKFFHLLSPSFDLFNATFFESIHSKTSSYARKKQIVVCGAPPKPGISNAISVILKLQNVYDFAAVFLMPQWSSDSRQFNDLQKRYPQVRFDNLNLVDLSRLFKQSMAVISSFGPGEQCPVTILDAYATSTLCITGEKGSLRLLNPAGICCKTSELTDVIKWVLEHPDKCIKLGQKGSVYLKKSKHVESEQKKQLQYIMECLKKKGKPGYLHKRYGRFIFGADKLLKICNIRCKLGDLRYSIQRKNWRSDVY